MAAIDWTVELDEALDSIISTLPSGKYVRVEKKGQGALSCLNHFISLQMKPFEVFKKKTVTMSQFYSGGTPPTQMGIAQPSHFGGRQGWIKICLVSCPSRASLYEGEVSSFSFSRTKGDVKVWRVCILLGISLAVGSRDRYSIPTLTSTYPHINLGKICPIYSDARLGVLCSQNSPQPTPNEIHKVNLINMAKAVSLGTQHFILSSYEQSIFYHIHFTPISTPVVQRG